MKVSRPRARQLLAPPSKRTGHPSRADPKAGEGSNPHSTVSGGEEEHRQGKEGQDSTDQRRIDQKAQEKGKDSNIGIAKQNREGVEAETHQLFLSATARAALGGSTSLPNTFKGRTVGNEKGWKGGRKKHQRRKEEPHGARKNGKEQGSGPLG
eukprot:GHVT01072604.1.p1 GENE.GHVT01072604.1~~GHVT01072604.1.p1  ORF type:complete len:153 (+),score=20.95 GHVT01072604.1:335-793(+)